MKFFLKLKEELTMITFSKMKHFIIKVYKGDKFKWDVCVRLCSGVIMITSHYN